MSGRIETRVEKLERRSGVDAKPLRIVVSGVVAVRDENGAQIGRRVVSRHCIDVVNRKQRRMSGELMPPTHPTQGETV
jgi:hypothetical protein